MEQISQCHLINGWLLNKIFIDKFQGVRYTAVDDQSIDPKLIYETLHKYFPMSQQHRQQQQQQQETSEEEEEEGEEQEESAT